MSDAVVRQTELSGMMKSLIGVLFAMVVGLGIMAYQDKTDSLTQIDDDLKTTMLANDRELKSAIGVMAKEVGGLAKSTGELNILMTRIILPLTEDLKVGIEENKRLLDSRAETIFQAEVTTLELQKLREEFDIDDGDRIYGSEAKVIHDAILDRLGQLEDRLEMLETGQ